MTNRFFALYHLSSSRSIWTKRGIALIALIAASFGVQAKPANMGSFIITNRDIAAGTASGTYIASGSGATGSFTLVRNNTRGYAGIEFTSGSNGIQIKNLESISVGNDRDMFEYTFAITPTNIDSIHTIKIGQASYADTVTDPDTRNGNSEIARQKLSYTPTTGPQATIKSNIDVPYFYDAMGDYFMGERVSPTSNSFRYNVQKSEPQLRFASTTSGDSNLYYYNMTSLSGTNNNNVFTPNVTGSQVRFASNTPNGTLPPTPTFANILKSSAQPSTYRALNQNTVIPNGGTYVSYGIKNFEGNYVVAVKNASSVTLNYEGIMNGNIGIPRAVVGETYKEWISFGVESEAAYYVFSGTVFNDNGGSTTPQINNKGYFNGEFDSASEVGITESTVKLVDCDNVNTVYDTENIVITSTTGQYKLRTPISNISSQSNICLIEKNSGSTYPVRTTNEKTVIPLMANKYNYENNNFGRVTIENAALTLKKYQYINNCDKNLDYINIDSDTSKPTEGFSIGIAENIEPGKCIAYKITATNRSNLPITNFVMQDTLQKKDVENSKVTSVLVMPIYNPDDYALDSVAVGKNNVPVKTKALTLAAKSSYDFYFNTKYGTTQSN